MDRDFRGLQIIIGATYHNGDFEYICTLYSGKNLRKLKELEIRFLTKDRKYL